MSGSTSTTPSTSSKGGAIAQCAPLLPEVVVEVMVMVMVI